MLTLVARARSWPPLPSLASLAHLVLNLHPTGEHRGGMFLEAEGTRDDQPLRLTWHLLAAGDDGPLIPSMAVPALGSKMKDASLPQGQGLGSGRCHSPTMTGLARAGRSRQAGDGRRPIS